MNKSLLLPPEDELLTGSFYPSFLPYSISLFLVLTSPFFSWVSYCLLFQSSRLHIHKSTRYRCTLLVVANCARSSSPALISAFAAFCPSGLSVRAISSLSIRSRVVFVSSSTSAALRWVVGMGLRTGRTKSQPASLCLSNEAVSTER